jgi:hypothetical protein
MRLIALQIPDADLRTEPRFAPLLANLPAQALVRGFMRISPHHALGVCVHARLL